MSNHSYEIEIKSLLGSQENAKKLVEKMKAKDPAFVEVGSHKQLNHYFIGGDLEKFYQSLVPHIEESKKEQFREITEKAKDYSIRTRLADNKLILVIKGAIDDSTSANGTARMEFESPIKNMTLDELDKIILDAGFQYQAKWSRERSDYQYRGANVSIDKNAGYGYLAEFEKVSDDETKAEELKLHLRDMMKELEVEELPQERLARMFDHYNKNWKDYYGTDNIFNIE